MFRSKRVWLIIATISLASASAFCGNAAATVFTFTGTDQTDDAGIMNALPTANFGVTTALDIGYNGLRKEMLRFDLSSLDGMVVTDASLKVVFASAAPASSATANLYKISTANADWVEGTGNGSAVVGANCWNKKAYDTTTPPAVNWAGTAGMSTAGTDYVNTVLGSFTVLSTAVAGTAYTVDFADVSFLQDWIDHPSNNGGFMLTAPSTPTAFRLASSEHATAGYRPVLTVTATPAPEPSSVVLLGIGVIGLLAYAWRKRK